MLVLNKAKKQALQQPFTIVSITKIKYVKQKVLLVHVLGYPCISGEP